MDDTVLSIYPAAKRPREAGQTHTPRVAHWYL